MIVDSRLELHNSSGTITSASAIVNCANVIDMETVRDFGHGQPLYFVVVITTTFAGGSGAQFRLVSDSVESFPTDTTVTEHVDSGPIPLATLAAGTIFAWALPGEGQAYERYIGAQVESVGTTSAGQIDAFLTFEPSIWTAKADSGIN